jgi:triosephosphate isomerase
MRRPMVVANWKMNTRASDAYILATTIRNAIAPIEGIEVVVCPPSIWLGEVSDILKKDGKVNVGAQNMFYEAEGAYTGEISPLMIVDIAKYVIIGHSERRAYFFENDFIVNEKVLAAIKHGLTPIICVGEKNKTSPISDAIKQLNEALTHLPKNRYKDVVVAYEPVWAIGKGKVASMDHIVKAMIKIREVVGRDTPILYGGSVNTDHITDLAKRPEIDGVLVGSASIRAASFIKICQEWSSTKSFKSYTA